jgi:hypothetical protein
MESTKKEAVLSANSFSINLKSAVILGSAVAGGRPYQATQESFGFSVPATLLDSRPRFLSLLNPTFF